MGTTVETVAAPPFWLEGHLAPVVQETTAFGLEVDGAVPPELCGLYARNGANPRSGHSGHWFLGDGMLHGVSLRGGRAEWYRNRWVRTPRFEQATRDDPLRWSLANTNVMSHAGKIFALVENALPMRMSRELDTLGFEDLGGPLKTAFDAGEDLGSGAYSALRQYDMRTGRSVDHVFAGGVPSEFSFAPASGRAGEDEGWAMGFVFDRARNQSDLVILDARRLADKPVARVRLPARVPQGFHGNWMAAP